MRNIFFGLMLGMFLSAVNQTIVATALPTIGRDLGNEREAQKRFFTEWLGGEAEYSDSAYFPLKHRHDLDSRHDGSVEELSYRFRSWSNSVMIPSR